MLDRFDIHIYVQSLNYNNLESKESECSEIIKERVNNARIIQLKRYKENGIYSNSELTPGLMKKYCKLNSESNKVLKQSFEKLKLSARAYSKILKVARTIADLDGKENIEKIHIFEAIQYRNLDRM